MPRWPPLPGREGRGAERAAGGRDAARHGAADGEALRHRVLDEAITEAVRLSHRYISGRQLPDKAISVLDTACAKVALGTAQRRP
jgi:hypothetical protein